MESLSNSIFYVYILGVIFAVKICILRTPAILPFELLTLSTKKEESHVSCSGAPLRILGPLDSIFTRALLRSGGAGGGGGGGGGVVIYYRNRDCVPEPVFFSPSPKSDYTVSAIKFVQFCM